MLHPPSACRATRADDRRRHLIDVARKLFTEHGFHATGVAQIAAASGIRVGQIYRDFSGKEDIVAAIVAEDVAAFLDEDVRLRTLAGARVSAQDYLRTRRMQQEMKAAFAQAMEGIDALLTPTTESAAIPLDSVDQAVMPSRFTRFGNLLELCALALPDGATAGGLPLSLQIVCRGYDEATALRIGQAYQGATEWHLREPAL